MKLIQTVILLCMLMIASCTSQSSNTSDQTAEASANEWIVLFDGSNTDHWISYNGDSFPQTGWSIQDNMLVFEQPVDGSSDGRRNIVTKDKFENFHLQLDWKITERSNSGIFYGVLQQQNQEIFWSGPEYQIIDTNVFNEINNDTKKRITGALYDLVEPNPKNMSPIGEWNHTEIIVDGSTIIHRLNDETILEIERWTPEWFEMIRNSKFASHNEFGNVREGHIGIQDYSGSIMIRNVRIKKL